MREMLKRRGKFGLLQTRANVRHLAVDQESFFETDRVVHLRQFFRRQPCLAARNHVTFARVLDGRPQHDIERQLAALRLGRLPGKQPCRHRARYG